MNWYKDGDLYVAVELGMPEQSVRIGTGETPQEARENLCTTAIQSTGPDSGLGAGLRWAHYAGWIGEPSTLDAIEDPE